MFALSFVLLLLLGLEDHPVEGASPLSELLRPLSVVTSSTTPSAVPLSAAAAAAAVTEVPPPPPSPRLDTITLEDPRSCPLCAVEKSLSGESGGGGEGGGGGGEDASAGGSQPLPPPSSAPLPHTPPLPLIPLDREGFEEVIRSLRVSAIKAKLLSHLEMLGAASTMNVVRRDLPSILTEGHFLMKEPPPPRPAHHAKHHKRIVVISNSSLWCDERTQHPSASFQITLDESLLALRHAVAVLWAWKVPDGGDNEPQLLRLREMSGSHDRRGDAGRGVGDPRRRGWTVSHNVTRLSEGWVHFDVSQALRKWKHSLREAPSYRRSKTLELEVTCPTCTSPRHAFPIDPQKRHRPFLVVEGVEATDMQRLRRSTGSSGGGSSSTPSCSSSSECCLKPLHINFKDLGWDRYVVYPKSYSASYCSGDCLGGLPKSNNYSSLIRTILRAENSPFNASMRAALTPCCAPTRFEPLQVLLMSSDNSVQDTILPNMVVKDCQCSF
ncbi:uncharacterized protein LOC143021315 isoform X2 [Oratosquilla oratoria]|uniref:uncharacterized protein LOC143021315 isoform X2 n=1 Tax=Oratosquilla oratoria TaxID=337810 RepID=UPI003F76D0D8